MSAEACGRCRFFDPQIFKHTYLGIDTGDKPIEGHGYCHARAPALDPRGRGVGRFPIVPASEWCGDFKPAPHASAPPPPPPPPVEDFDPRDGIAAPKLSANPRSVL